MRTRRALRRVAVICAALAALTQVANLAGPFEADTVDARFQLRGAVDPPPNVRLVLVDDVTLEELRAQWPFPRDFHAKVIDRLKADGARVIAYDVVFSEPSDDPDADSALLDAADAARPVVFSVVATDGKGGTDLFGGGPIVDDVGARPAISLLAPDAGRVLRRVDAGEAGVPSFAVAAAQAFTGRPIAPSSFPEPGDDAYIAYAGPPGTIPRTSFSTVLRGRFPAGTFRDKIVVVGASDPSLQDVHPVPTVDHAVMAGAEVQANAIATAVAGFPLRTIPVWLAALAAAALATVVPLLALRLPLGGALAGGALAAFVWPAAAYGLFLGPERIAPVVTPLAGLVLGTIGTVATSAVGQAFERARTRDAFARFTPASVVDEVLAEAGDGARLGGRRMECTVLFCDLRGFTSFSERLEPELVIDILNRYLSEMSDAILDHGGTLVSYAGDGIMCVFGAPLEQDDHADRAVAAAREMSGPRLKSFNTWVGEQGRNERFSMGIGINTGPVLSGNVGSLRRMEYTAIGDTTNTASRLESLTKTLPGQVVLADATRRALSAEAGGLVDLGEVDIRGRVGCLHIWGLNDAA